MSALNDVLTTAQAAAVIGIDIAHVRRLLETGKLTGTKRGRDWLIPRQAVYDEAAQPPATGPGRPRQGWGGTDHEQLVALIRRHGPLAMAQQAREGFALTLTEGWDFGRWQVSQGRGMLLFFRVHWLPPGVAPEDGRRHYLITGEKRVMAVNAPETERTRYQRQADATGDPVLLLMVPFNADYEPLRQTGTSSRGSLG